MSKQYGGSRSWQKRQKYVSAVSEVIRSGL